MKKIFNLYLEKEFLILILFGLKITIKLKSLDVNNNNNNDNINILKIIESNFCASYEKQLAIEEKILLSNGEILSKQQYSMTSDNINDYEFKVFSQFGDDGIIQYLIKNIRIENKIFIEFGVENYQESNTRFLLMNNNWTGFVIDGSKDNIQYLQNRPWYWKYDIESKEAFIDKGNINKLLADTKFNNIGILSIDIDGNDYWIFETIDLSKLNPAIIIIEYNSVFGKDRAITVPYDKNFNRTEKHYSNLYFGSSLKALELLADLKGYALIGVATTGHNSYFVRKDLLNKKINAKSTEEVYIYTKFRESRNLDGSLSYYSREKRLELIKGLDVFNVENKQYEKL